MSDVSGVVLSVGEPYTDRAVASLAAQTLLVENVIVISNVSPFSRAINQGAAQVHTAFFVQVDADMVLDSDCVATLRSHVTPETGIVVAELRDALLGQTVGVKLFRTACFRESAMPDSVAQDLDFGIAMARRGWRTTYVREPGADPGALPPTLGEHRPDYTPAYTFRKLLVEGARIPVRGARHGLFWQMGTLERSAHPVAVLAQMAFGHGVFLDLQGDQHKPADPDDRAAWLMDLLASDGRIDGLLASLQAVVRDAPLGEVFERFVTAGASIAQANAGDTLRELLVATSGVRRNARRLVAKVALAHGLLAGPLNGPRLRRDAHRLRDLVVYGVGVRAGWVTVARARGRHTIRRTFGKADAW